MLYCILSPFMAIAINATNKILHFLYIAQKELDVRINTCYYIVAIYPEILYYKRKECSPMPMKPREMIKLLENNGFVIVSQNGSHQKLFCTETNTTVVVPIHSKELKKGTEQGILKKAGIKK